MNTQLATLPVLLLSAACATGATGSGTTYALSEVDEGPRLLGCSAYMPPVGGGGNYRAEVIFDVTADGAVTNTQGRDISEHQLKNVVSMAQRAARSCRYEPAMKDGRAVAVSGVRKSFRFGSAGGV